jgi:hypothetical protein
VCCFIQEKLGKTCKAELRYIQYEVFVFYNLKGEWI